MLDIKPTDNKKEHKIGTESIIPVNSPLIGVKLGKLEEHLDITFDHYHTYYPKRGGYSHRIFQNIGEHKIEARDMIKYFGKDSAYITELWKEIQVGADLSQLCTIAKAQTRRTLS